MTERRRPRSTPARPRAEPTPRRTDSTPRHGIARVLSKLGLCSRSQAEAWVRAGRVRVDGAVVRDVETPVRAERQRIAVDEVEVAARERVYLMLNKPRGVVTSAADERGRDTVYAAFAEAGLPWIAPVGRLDKASEGLLLFSNDSVWSAAITAPASHLAKTYHVKIDRLPDAGLLDALRAGIDSEGETLTLKTVRELRRGARNAWLEIELDEGRNRQIRRVLAACEVGVLRLVRVAIGGLRLGALGKGAWRPLDASEVDLLRPATSAEVRLR